MASSRRASKRSRDSRRAKRGDQDYPYLRGSWALRNLTMEMRTLLTLRLDNTMSKVVAEDAARGAEVVVALTPERIIAEEEAGAVVTVATVATVDTVAVDLQEEREAEAVEEATEDETTLHPATGEEASEAMAQEATPHHPREQTEISKSELMNNSSCNMIQPMNYSSRNLKSKIECVSNFLCILKTILDIFSMCEYLYVNVTILYSYPQLLPAPTLSPIYTYIY